MSTAVIIAHSAAGPANIAMETTATVPGATGAPALRAKRLATRVPSAGELDGGDELLTG